MSSSLFSFSKLFASCLILSLFACSHQGTTFTLTNNSNIARTNEPLALSREAIISKVGDIPDGRSPVLIDAQGDTIPSQLDDLDRDGTWDELAFLAAVPADTSLAISLTYVATADYPEFTPRTNIRFGVKDSSGIHNRKELTLTREELPAAMYARFQMDGPAWENDKIGFRHYIDGRNARDLYGKKSSKMALDTVGISQEDDLTDNYHVMEYWGRDILSVGNSLGSGGLAMMNKGTPVRLGVKIDASKNNIDTTKYHLITEGPVRTIFKLTYKGWHVGNRTVDVVDQISIWGGHYWYGNKIALQDISKEDTLVVGLVNSNNNKPLMVLDDIGSDWIGLATHDKQTYEKKWYLGLALILPKKQYITYQKAPETGPGITNSYNALMKMNNSSSMRYYVLGGWEISDKKFADRNYFKKFAQNEITKIQRPISIR